MHLRRALLLFALVLGLTALATSIAPTPRHTDDTPVTPPPQAAVPDATNVFLRAPSAKVRTYRVARNARVAVQVAAAEGGQVEIPRLGQVQAVGSGSTVEFDLLDLAPGPYYVLFEPALGDPVRIATIVSR